MITPQFDVKQDNDFVFVEIRAPYVKASMIQFEVANDLFVFSLPPYYLRLRLPGTVIEDERMNSHYDIKTSKIHCRVAKLHPGEHFPDLDMLSKLLATKQQQNSSTPAKPTIQEVDGTRAPQDDDDAEFDWEIEQEVPSETGSSVAYGFNNQYSERIGLSLHTGNEINELAEPEREAVEQRLQLMRSTTTDQFDVEHYLADLYDDDMIKELLHYKFPDTLELTDAAKDRVLKLGYREFMLSHPKATYIGIIPLVFAWAYDFRTNLGDSTVESSWNVGKLAPSMCFLYNNYQSVGAVVQDCTARALTKPLYRNWLLTLQVWKDVLQVLRQGRKALLAVFGNLLEIFENELHYCYRQILVEDYTIWIQHASENVITSLTSELEKYLNGFTKQSSYIPIAAAENGDLLAGSEKFHSEAQAGDALPDSDDDSDDDSGTDSAEGTVN